MSILARRALETFLVVAFRLLLSRSPIHVDSCLYETEKEHAMCICVVSGIIAAEAWGPLVVGGEQSVNKLNCCSFDVRR